MSQNLYFHIHIWKAAGTTFFDICKRNFGGGFCRDHMLYHSWFLTKEQVGRMVSYHGWLRCYSSHMVSGDLPFEDHPDIKGITFVRDPVERILSNYKFQSSKRYKGGETKTKTLDEYLESAIYSKDEPYYRNGYAYQLCGARTAEAVDAYRRLVADGKMIPFIVERFDDACIILERLFPEDFKDCSYARQNISDKNKIDASAHREKLAGYMELDFEICKFANEYMDAQLAGLFEDEASLQTYRKAFASRCSKRQKRAQFIELLKPIYRKLRALTGK